MEVIHLETTCLDQRIIQLFSIQTPGEAYFTYSIVEKKRSSQYQSDRIYATELAAYAAAWFFCLRADLDGETSPAIVVDRRCGHVLSVNLPAYGLFGMDITGFKLVDFAADGPTATALQRYLDQGDSLGQGGLIYSADGQVLSCQLSATTAAHHRHLGILRLRRAR